MPKHNTRFVSWFDQQVTDTTPVVAARVVEDYDGCALNLIALGTLAGAWLLEVSNNYDPNGSGTGDFVDVTSLFTFTGNGGAGNKTVTATAVLQRQVATSPARLDVKALRVTWTATSGAGRAACIFGGKGAE